MKFSLVISFFRIRYSHKALMSVESLQGGLLCYEEEDASLLQAVYVALQQVIAHQVEVFFLLLQQVFPR
mgnify:CR=1 FL=1